MVSKFRREDHALFVIRAHAILSQVPRRVGNKIPLQGFAGFDAGPHPRDYHPDVQRTGRPYRQRGLGARSCPYVPVDPTEALAVQRYATDQRALIAPYPDGVSRTAKALLGKAVLGTWILLDYIWECDRRCHQAVSGITFRQMMPPASAGGSSLHTSTNRGCHQ